MVYVIISYVSPLIISDTYLSYLTTYIFYIYSAAAGWAGMSIATDANVRTTQAADKEGLSVALRVAFTGGAVMGFVVSYMCVSFWFGCVIYLWIYNVYITCSWTYDVSLCLLIIISFLSSLLSLFRLLD